MENLKARHAHLFSIALAQGLGAGAYTMSRRPISGHRLTQSQNPLRQDLENIGGDFHAAVRKEKASRRTSTTAASY